MKCFIASHIVTFKIIVQFYEFFSKSHLLYFLLILLILSALFISLTIYFIISNFSYILVLHFHEYFTFISYFVRFMLFLILSDSLLVQIVTTKIQTFLQKKKEKFCAIYFCLHQNKF